MAWALFFGKDEPLPPPRRGVRWGGEEVFVDEGAGDVDAVWLYQCRGGASVFRTGGHYVGFVVDLQGAV